MLWQVVESRPAVALAVVLGRPRERVAVDSEFA
jgi:hypothetical protein